MRIRLLIAGLAGLAGAALGFAPPAGLDAHPAASPAVDWSLTVQLMPGGGYRMGNPAAANKLVEYGSRTCPTCRQFDLDARQPMRTRIRAGTLSYEFRDFPVHGAIDLAPILLGRCVAPARYFPFLSAMFDMQDDAWAKFRAIPKAQIDALGKDPNKIAAGLGARMGYVALSARFGLTPAKAQACLADKAAIAALEKRAQAAAAAGVTSTPSFILNGQPLSAFRWDGIEAVLALNDK